MKRHVRQVPKAGPSFPQTINFFSHFDPDARGKTNLENTILVCGFFTARNKLLVLDPPELERLSAKAFRGNSKAANSLVELATHLCFRIAALEKMQPKMMSKIAGLVNVWPIVADMKIASGAETQERLNELGLGTGTVHIDPRFRKAGGCDDNHPARLWAKSAVLCVSETRFFQRQLILREKIVVTNMQSGLWKRGDEPAWVSMTKDLPDFSQTPTTRKKWADVIRPMIRQQMPDFQSRPEWSNQWNSCKQRGRGTKGVVQNTILDDIVSALKTVAPNDIGQPAEDVIPNFCT